MLTMNTLPISKICILCRHTFDNIQHNKRRRSELDKKVDLINKFSNEVLVHYDSAVEQDVNDTLNLDLEAVIVCGKCSVIMEAAVEANIGVERVEKKVGRLQLQLLKQLKMLQTQLSLFYEKMKKIQLLIETGKVTSPPCDLQGHDGLNIFENKIIQDLLFGWVLVVKNLSLFNGRIHDNMAGSATSVRKQPSSSQEDKLDACLVKPDPQITTPIKSEAASDEDMDFNCTADQANEDLELGERNSNISNNEDKPEDDNHSAHGCSDDENGNGSNNARKKEDNDVKSSSDQEDEHNDSKKSDQLLRQKIMKNIMSSVDFTGMSQFKKETIVHVIRRKEHILQKIPFGRALGRQDKDPLYKYFIDYNPKTDTFCLEDTTIILGDGNQGNFLECSKCFFRTQKEDNGRTSSSADARMLEHILGKHLNAFHCLPCNYIATSHNGFLRHLDKHSSGNVICDICGKPLGRKKFLKNHKWLHMSKEEKEQSIKSGIKPPNNNTKAQNSKPFQCSVCGKSFGVKFHLQGHEQTHKSREERIMTVCQVCGKSMVPRTFYTHRQFCKPLGKEGPPTTTKCIHSDCSRTFKTIRLMKDHFKRIHSEQGQQRNQHTCPTCGKGFMRNSEMVTHMKSHSSDRPFTCSKGCQGTFKTLQVCTRHEKICTGFGTRPGPKTGKRKPKFMVV